MKRSLPFCLKSLLVSLTSVGCKSRGRDEEKQAEKEAGYSVLHL